MIAMWSSEKPNKAFARAGGHVKQYEAQTVDELNELIMSFGSEVLFRGQTSHYGEPGRPSIITSFDRTTCIPSEMLKWCRYSQSVLDTFIAEHRADFRFQQALLQHYGWRSFFIDCTSDPAVSAWFASHKYSERQILEVSEDCEERAVWLRKRMAGYTPSTGEGHIYVLSKQAANEIGLVDLATLSVAGFRPRTVAQSAWLLGPQHGPISQDCYLAQITVPVKVLQTYAENRGLVGTNTLFPSADEDPILKALLGLPWEELNAAASLENLPAFKRCLELPEYHPSFVKNAPPRPPFIAVPEFWRLKIRLLVIRMAGLLSRFPTWCSTDRFRRPDLSYSAN
ncbi:FRG domain-containing protein [Pseudomonas coleopterorum]|uniref:FRG domain-containing protein n=1 Tax=Pseudomonas coleopterorum TaxID=1605838 RepID=UPI0028AA501D|nr:FRG domain-containing protein [Pseudomonas coleopterorum]